MIRNLVAGRKDPPMFGLFTACLRLSHQMLMQSLIMSLCSISPGISLGVLIYLRCI